MSMYCDVQAEGLYSLNPTSVPPAVERLLRTSGNLVIKELRVYREPVAEPVKMVVQAVSRRKFGVMYHVYQVITTAYAIYRIDKNQSVEVKTLKWYPNGEFEVVPLHNRQVTIRDYFAAAEMYHPYDLWEYDAQDANCQKFVDWCVSANYYPVDPRLRKFYLQNIDLPLQTQKAAKVITTAAAVGSRALDLVKSIPSLQKHVAKKFSALKHPHRIVKSKLGMRW